MTWGTGVSYLIELANIFVKTACLQGPDKSTRRRTSNNRAIEALKVLDTEEDATALPEGLMLDLDASNNSSYFGTGAIWYDLAESPDVAGNDADLVGISTFIVVIFFVLMIIFVFSGLKPNAIKSNAFS